jgi:hypothetical protein
MQHLPMNFPLGVLVNVILAKALFDSHTMSSSTHQYLPNAS